MLGNAGLRAAEFGIAAGYVSEEKVGVAACLGATWIGGGVAGTIELLARSLRTGGLILIGEPYMPDMGDGFFIVNGGTGDCVPGGLDCPEGDKLYFTMDLDGRLDPDPLVLEGIDGVAVVPAPAEVLRPERGRP